MTDIYDISSAPSARMCDFGRRLEAALRERFADYNRKCTEPPTWDDVVQSVRAANAQVSAPAPVTGESPAQSVDISGAGAGVDLEPAMRRWLRRIADGEPVGMSSKDARALLSHIESLERDAERRDEIVRTSISELSWFRKNLPENLRDTFDQDLNYLSAARKEGKP